jgi:hypothetical protein
MNTFLIEACFLLFLFSALYQSVADPNAESVPAQPWV